MRGCQRHPFLSCSIWNTEVCSTAWVGGTRRGWQEQQPGHSTAPKRHRSYWLLCGLHWEVSHKLLGMIRLWIPQLAYGYPPYRLSLAPHTSLLHTTTLWLPSYVHEPPQMSSEHVQKASQIISAFCDESLIIISDLLLCWN